MGIRRVSHPWGMFSCVYTQAVTTHVLLGGGFNAHIAHKKEVTGINYDVPPTHPQLIEKRRSCCPHMNRAGTRLIDLASNDKLIITTGHIEDHAAMAVFLDVSNKSTSHIDTRMVPG
eukprot:549958-Pelagomonas_calceolata.AAC.1